MTPLDLRGVRELLDAVAHGPHEVWTVGHGGLTGHPYVETTEVGRDGNVYGAELWAPDLSSDEPTNARCEANARFIAVSRTAIPQLLALVDELQRARDEACDLLSSATACSCGMGVRCFDCANLDRLRAIGQRAEGGVK